LVVMARRNARFTLETCVKNVTYDLVNFCRKELHLHASNARRNKCRSSYIHTVSLIFLTPLIRSIPVCQNVLS